MNFLKNINFRFNLIFGIISWVFIITIPYVTNDLTISFYEGNYNQDFLNINLLVGSVSGIIGFIIIYTICYIISLLFKSVNVHKFFFIITSIFLVLLVIKYGRLSLTYLTSSKEEISRKSEMMFNRSKIEPYYWRFDEDLDVNDTTFMMKFVDGDKMELFGVLLDDYKKIKFIKEYTLEELGSNDVEFSHTDFLSLSYSEIVYPVEKSESEVEKIFKYEAGLNLISDDTISFETKLVGEFTDGVFNETDEGDLFPNLIRFIEYTPTEATMTIKNYEVRYNKGLISKPKLDSIKSTLSVYLK